MKLRKVTQADQSAASSEEPNTGRIGSIDSPVSIEELTEHLSSVVSDQFSNVVVRGEVASFHQAGSGHRYLSLKGPSAALSSVMWRTRRLDGAVDVGTEVIAQGGITIYAPRGAYQLDCRSIQPIGAGSLAAAFERTKKRLAAEGLFEPDRKRPLPLFPRRIGLVTSATGAAVQDMIDTIGRRMPTVEIVISPTRVQGNGAANEIVAAMQALIAVEPDVVIVGRGGGSPEDLAAFNDESLARSIAAFPVPVVSAVGHEIDFSIADFVADVRAATPTAGAELAVRDRTEILSALSSTRGRMLRSLDDRLARMKLQLDVLVRSRGLGRPQELVRRFDQRLDELRERARRAQTERLRRLSSRIETDAARLKALDPSRVLARGYSLTEINGIPVGSIRELTAGTEIIVRMHDGRLAATVTSTEPTENQ